MTTATKTQKELQQEAVDINYDWFVVHGHGPSVTCEDELCAYRGEGGNKCGIGLLIPDEAYSPLIEGECIRGILDPRQSNKCLYDGFDAFVEASKKVSDALSSYDTEFLVELQMCHDSATDWMSKLFSSEYPVSLKQLCTDYGLTYPGDK